jgi:hypothetical protein
MINGKGENIDEVITYRSFPARLVITILIGVILITSISAVTHVFAVGQISTTLPTCTDPTGQNLPCMMVISTLPPPPNAIQCQETSGQILPCAYATQSLSNGEQIVAITVYVPANYVFTGYGPWIVVKQVVHETKTRVVHVPECPKGQTLDPKTQKCVDITYCPPPKGYHLDPKTQKCVPDNCPPGQVYNPLTGKCEPGKCERADAGAKTDLDIDLKTIDCDINDPNEHGKTPQLPCEHPDADAKTDPDTNLKTKDCDLSDANEHRTTPSTSPVCNSPNYNGTCLPTNNMTIAASGGSGKGTKCVNNCTTGTTPPIDCAKNPADPSCTQTLTPSTTSPTTKTCPDGSVIDANANCPTQSTPPPTNTNPPPSGNNNPPPSTDNNPPPSSSDNGNNNNPSSGGGGSGVNGG